MKTYGLKVLFTEPLLGTVPRNQEVYRRYIETKKPAELAEDNEADTIDEIEARGWTGFHANGENGGLFLYDYSIKGFLKEAADIQRPSFLPLKNAKVKLENTVYVFPRRVPLLGADGKPVLLPNQGEPNYGKPIERPLRAMTMQGPRITVMRSDYVPAGTFLVCEIQVLDSSQIDERHLRICLDFGAFKGMGQFRSGSYGRFEYVLEATN